MYQCIKLKKVISFKSEITSPTHQVNKHNYSTGACSYKVTKLDNLSGHQVVSSYDTGEEIFSVDYKVFTGSEQACNDFVRSQSSLR